MIIQEIRCEYIVLITVKTMVECITNSNGTFSHYDPFTKIVLHMYAIVPDDEDDN